MINPMTIFIKFVCCDSYKATLARIDVMRFHKSSIYPNMHILQKNRWKAISIPKIEIEPTM